MPDEGTEGAVVTDSTSDTSSKDQLIDDLVNKTGDAADPDGSDEGGQHDSGQVTDNRQTEPQGGHDFNKGLQKLQMELGNIKRQLDNIGTRTDSHQKAPAAAQQIDTDELDSIINDQAGEYTDAEKLLAKRLKSVTEQYETKLRQVTAELDSTSQQTYRIAFASQHPDLADKYDDLVRECSDKLDLYRDEPPEARRVRAEYLWRETVEKARAEAHASMNKKPSSKPDKGTNGTVIRKSNPPAPDAGRRKTKDELLAGLIRSGD